MVINHSNFDIQNIQGSIKDWAYDIQKDYSICPFCCSTYDWATIIERIFLPKNPVFYKLSLTFKIFKAALV